MNDQFPTISSEHCMSVRQPQVPQTCIYSAQVPHGFIGSAPYVYDQYRTYDNFCAFSVHLDVLRKFKINPEYYKINSGHFMINYQHSNISFECSTTTSTCISSAPDLYRQCATCPYVYDQFRTYYDHFASSPNIGPFCEHLRSIPNI